MKKDNSSSSSESGNGSNFLSDEVKDYTVKINGNRFEYDLFHDEDNKIEKVIRVKRSVNSSNEESWDIYQDNKNILSLESSKLSEEEQKFLRSVEGFNFLIAQVKTGISNASTIKKNLRKHLKEKTIDS